MAIKDRFIKKEDISNLLWIMDDDEISMRDLSHWIKSKTDDEFIVAPRNFVEMTVSFFEIKAEEMKDSIPHADEMIEDFKIIKQYL